MIHDRKEKRFVMVEKNTIKPLKIEGEAGRKRVKNNLKFFVERSSETIERTLGIIQKLQQEINQLKDGITKADNEFQNLNRLSQKNKKTEN
ncbi:hypothetical protein OAN21_00830 [Alphaproteobacteria bacterium]|nr:hypothetical protein [Alphaproteobacteria bacterium]